MKEGKGYEWLMSIVQVNIVEISFGASENYATGGIAVDGLIKSEMGIQEIKAVSVLDHTVSGWIPFFNVSTGRIQFFGQEPTNASSGVIALSEMGNGSTVINNKKVKLLVFGV